MYADDVAVITDDADTLRVAVELLHSTFSERGLIVGTAKTKLLIVGRDADAQAADLNIALREDRLEAAAVSKFKYTGSVITADNTFDAEVSHRIASAGDAGHQLKVA